MKSSPSRFFAEVTAVTRTTVSPYCTKTEPFACFATFPVSMENGLPPKSICNLYSIDSPFDSKHTTLPSQTQLIDDHPISVYFGFFQVVEKSPPLSDQFKKT